MTTYNTPKPMTPEEIERLRRFAEEGMLIGSEDASRLIATIDHLRAQQPAAIPDAESEYKDKYKRVRAALIASGQNAGALLTDAVSDDFLMHIPEEIASLNQEAEGFKAERDIMQQQVAEAKAEGRREGLEEAAKIAEGSTAINGRRWDHCGLAMDIRALIESQTPSPKLEE